MEREMRMLYLKAAVAGLSLLVSTFVFAEDLKWMDSFEAAKTAAKEGNKYILVDFSGSDWCGWCMKLEKKVFSTPEFKEYASKNLILFMADFPRNKTLSPEMKKQNEALMKKYGVEGFPTVLLLTTEGKTILTTGYKEGGPKPFIESLQEAIRKTKMFQVKKSKLIK
jgi:thioredoxin-related protein